MSSSASSARGFPELDKYELLEEIGHGGMATVYRARDLRLDREVAVKVIHKHLRENLEVRRRFVSEAKAVAKLRHPAIVDVYDVSAEDDDERYLVVELIRGMSLRQLLQERQLLPPEVAATIAARLCDAVEHAHQSGVIHRDIKPENVLLELPGGVADTAPDTGPPTDPDGDVSVERRLSDASSGGGSAKSRARVVIKLTDFGIAKVLDAQGVTSTGQILGSPAHMAPEQIEGGDVGPWTDVFALGVLMYEMMVGHLPFEGKNPAQVLRRVLDGNYDPADAERPEVGGRWQALLAGALATKVEDRTASAAELAAQIRAELEGLGIGDPNADMVFYFENELGYHDQVRTKLVPRLIERGERERRAGNIPGAAADFNRALALKPDDMAILKRVSSLSAETVWRERGMRFGALALAGCALFGVTYGATRWLKESEVHAALTSDVPVPPPPETATAPSAVAPVTTVEPTTEEPTLTTTSAKVPLPGPAPAPPVASSSDADAAPSTGRVRFAVIPQGATLSVDGSATSWFGVVHQMSVGRHSFVAEVPGPCCDETRGTFDVAPSGDEDAPQNVHILVTIRPAMFVLKGAPAGGTVSCKGVTASAGGGAVALKLTRETEWRGRCEFSSGATVGVVLPAGVTTTIQWQG